MVSSEFISKIEFACKKKESLYSQSKFKYAIRDVYKRQVLQLVLMKSSFLKKDSRLKISLKALNAVMSVVKNTISSSWQKVLCQQLNLVKN